MFDGITVEKQDLPRLTRQFDRVFAYMMTEEWHSIPEIVNAISFPPYERASEGGVSARLRDFRKEKFGGHTVNRRKRTNGLYEYQLVTK